MLPHCTYANKRGFSLEKHCASYSTICLNTGKRDRVTKTWRTRGWPRELSHCLTRSCLSVGTAREVSVYMKSWTIVCPHQHFTALKPVSSYHRPPFLLSLLSHPPLSLLVNSSCLPPSLSLCLALSLWACDRAADLWEL